MLTQEKANAITKLLQNETFDNEIKDAVEFEDFRKVFAKYGVDVTKEDIDEIARVVAIKQGQELSDEDLDKVSGGGLFGAMVVGLVGGTLFLGACYAFNRWGLGNK